MAIREPKRRNRTFARRRAEIVEAAVSMLADNESQALSFSSLAEVLGVNRSTIFYHFASQEELVDEIAAESSKHLNAVFEPLDPDVQATSPIVRKVLANPGLLKLWVTQFIQGEDVRKAYPDWDGLVEEIRHQAARGRPGEEVDAEVLSMLLLIGMIIGPYVLMNGVLGSSDIESVATRFRDEMNRLLARTA